MTTLYFLTIIWSSFALWYTIFLVTPPDQLLTSIQLKSYVEMSELLGCEVRIYMSEYHNAGVGLVSSTVAETRLGSAKLQENLILQHAIEFVESVLTSLLTPNAFAMLSNPTTR